MQGEVSKDDTIFGVTVLAIFLVFVFVLGYAINRVKNWRFRGRWAPLLPVINNPKITEDGGGAATSWLSGTYRDAKVYASMTPGISKYSGEGGGPKANRFSVALQDVAGRHDWTVEWKGSIPVIRKPGWAVSSKDQVLQAQLEGTPVIALVSPLGEAVLSYSAGQRSLVWTADIEPAIILTPDQFRRTLDALIEVASINKSVNGRS